MYTKVLYFCISILKLRKMANIKEQSHVVQITKAGPPSVGKRVGFVKFIYPKLLPFKRKYFCQQVIWSKFEGY
jgi:hypothetical protein